MSDLSDVDPGDRSRVNESSHPARLDRRLHHETQQSHARCRRLIRKSSDHSKAQNSEKLIAHDLVTNGALAVEGEGGARIRGGRRNAQFGKGER